MRAHLVFTTLYAFTNVTHALYPGKYCPLACETSINYVTFNDTDSWLSRKVRQCRSELRTTSLYLCFDEYCASHEEVEEWIGEQTPWCEEHAGVTLPAFHDLVNRWSPDGKAGVKRLPADKALEFPVIDEVVIPAGRFFERAFSTMVRTHHARADGVMQC
jgi:hypothetical protein